MGTSRCSDVGQRLPVVGEHLVADVGQTDRADQQRVQVVAAGRRSVSLMLGGVVDGREQVGRGVGVGVEHRRRDLDVVVEVVQAGVRAWPVQLSRSTSVWPNLSPRPLKRLGDRAEGLVELGRVDLGQHRDQLLEDGVDLDGDVSPPLITCPALQRLRRRVGGRHQFDELRAEHRRGGDVDAHVGRDVPTTGRGRCARCRAAVPSGSGSMEATLPTWAPLHLDLGVGVHHQAGAVGDHGHRNGFGEAVPEQPDGRRRDDRSDQRACTRQPARPAGARDVGSSTVRIGSVSPYPDRLKLPLEP